MPFFSNRDNLLYEIFYNYSCLWLFIAHFGKIFFHVPAYYETKFCVPVYKSVCVRAHAQTMKPTGLKFGTDILVRVFEKISKLFF